jgi:protein gp37
MAGSTAIEWTDATWNPVTGCTKISAGCDNCYAERFAERFRGTPDHPFEHGFDLMLRSERLLAPLSWKSPKMIFVNSMSDLFHKGVPFAFVDHVFETMERASWHTFQVLTKRSSRMRDYVNRRYADGAAPSHIWLGTSVEDGSRKSRIRHMQQMNASIRFLSVEPLIGPMGRIDLHGIDWVRADRVHGRWTQTGSDRFAISVATQASPSSSSNGVGLGRKVVGDLWTERNGASYLLLQRGAKFLSQLNSKP